MRQPSLFLALALLLVAGCHTNFDARRGENDRSVQNKLSDSTSTRVRGVDFGPR